MITKMPPPHKYAIAIILCVALTHLSTSSYAATVIWDVWEPTSNPTSSLQIWERNEQEGLPRVWPSIIMEVVEKNGRPKQAVISAVTYVLESVDNWVRLDAGALVNELSVRNAPSYFCNGELDGVSDPSTWDSIVQPYSTPLSFYLGFGSATFSFDENQQFVQGDVYYGWAEFLYKDGTLALVRSALNTEANGGIYVGTGITTPAIPEPATGALALAGTVLLFGRRRRGKKALSALRTKSPSALNGVGY